MVAPLENRPQTSGLRLSQKNGLAFNDGQADSPTLGFTEFMRDGSRADGMADLMTAEDLFDYRLKCDDKKIEEPEPISGIDAVEQAALLSEILGNIRASLTSESVQPVSVTSDEYAITQGAVDAAYPGGDKKPVVSVSPGETLSSHANTGYSLKQDDLTYSIETVRRPSAAHKPNPVSEVQEPEVLEAREILTDPKESYEPIGKQPKERVHAVAFSAKKLIKGVISGLSRTVYNHRVSASGSANSEQGRKLSRNRIIALGVATTIGLGAASSLATRGSGEGPLFGDSTESSTKVEVPAGTWAERIPTVMRWEADVIRLIKEYDKEAIEANERNRREKRPGVMPYGAVDSGLILSTMLVASGGNPFATDKNADPNSPDKIPAGLMGISRDVCRQLVLDCEPTNTEQSIKAGIALWQILLSVVPEADATDRPSLLSSALQGKRLNQPNMPYTSSPQLLEELVAAVPAIDSAWNASENPHVDNWLKNPAANEKLQLAVNEAKDSPLSGNTTGTQPTNKK